MGQQESLEINTNENTNKFEAIQENKTEKTINLNQNETENLNEQNDISNVIEDVYIVFKFKKIVFTN